MIPTRSPAPGRFPREAALAASIEIPPPTPDTIPMPPTPETPPAGPEPTPPEVEEPPLPPAEPIREPTTPPPMAQGAARKVH